MKLRRKITEANIAPKILADPRQTKLLALAMRHDDTIPRHKIAKLGPRVTDAELVQLWSEMLDQSLSNTKYGDLSRDGKFDAWLTRLYLNHSVDYEDIDGEAGDALGAWKALSIRNLLEPKDQDFNKLTSINQVQKMVRKPGYARELKRLADQSLIEKIKRDSKAITLIDDDRFKVDVPLNPGSCYLFNTAEGVDATYCTGASQRDHYFPSYSRNGPIVQILDKKNMNDIKGKWQMHTASNQLKQADQRNPQGALADKAFAELFPGLMKEITTALNSKSEELKTKSDEMNITRGGWNIAEEIARIQEKYPTAYHSKAEGEDDDDTQQGPAWKIMYDDRDTGETVRAPDQAAAMQKVIRKVRAIHPNNSVGVISSVYSVEPVEEPAAADREWLMVINDVFKTNVIRASSEEAAMDEAVRLISARHPTISVGTIRDSTRVVPRTPQTLWMAQVHAQGEVVPGGRAEPRQNDDIPELSNWEVIDMRNGRRLGIHYAAATRDEAFDRFINYMVREHGANDIDVAAHYNVVPLGQ